MRESSEQYLRARSTERTMIMVRWFAIALAAFQVATYYRPYPPHVEAAAFAVIGVFLAGNVVLWRSSRRWMSAAATRRIGFAAMTLDFVVAMALVTVYTFDVQTAIFALVYLLPLEAAVRYGRRGAIVTMLLATVAYTIRDIWGQYRYGLDFLAVSITYRMGIGLIIALVAGEMANRYAAEHRHVRALYDNEHRAAQALRDAQELRSTFLAAVSHELRTPLASVMGLSMTLEDRLTTGSTVTGTDVEMLGHVAAEARRLDVLLADLLDLERLTRGVARGTFQSASVDQVVHDVVGRVDADVARRLRLDLQPATAAIDRPKVERIVENLLSNAVKYTPTGCTIHVLTRTVTGGAEIRVEDEGAGVPPSLRSTIFEPFQRGSEQVGHAPGTGIGLSLVQRFSELHGGRAWVEERRGGGASFRVFLPDRPPGARH